MVYHQRYGRAAGLYACMYVLLLHCLYHECAINTSYGKYVTLQNSNRYCIVVLDCVSGTFDETYSGVGCLCDLYDFTFICLLLP